jgi:hypothetical protein
MKKCIKNLLDEIDSKDGIDTHLSVTSFEKKIKKEINRTLLLYNDSGGYDDYTLKPIDYVIMYYMWKYIDINATLQEILIIFYSFYKLEEFYFHPSVFCTSRIFYVTNNSNISKLILNILHTLNE